MRRGRARRRRRRRARLCDAPPRRACAGAHGARAVGDAWGAGRAAAAVPRVVQGCARLARVDAGRPPQRAAVGFGARARLRDDGEDEQRGRRCVAARQRAQRRAASARRAPHRPRGDARRRRRERAGRVGRDARLRERRREQRRRAAFSFGWERAHGGRGAACERASAAAEHESRADCDGVASLGSARRRHAQGDVVPDAHGMVLRGARGAGPLFISFVVHSFLPILFCLHFLILFMFARGAGRIRRRAAVDAAGLRSSRRRGGGGGSGGARAHRGEPARGFAGCGARDAPQQLPLAEALRPAPAAAHGANCDRDALRSSAKRRVRDQRAPLRRRRARHHRGVRGGAAARVASQADRSLARVRRAPRGVGHDARAAAAARARADGDRRHRALRPGAVRLRRRRRYGDGGAPRRRAALAPRPRRRLGARRARARAPSRGRPSPLRLRRRSGACGAERRRGRRTVPLALPHARRQRLLARRVPPRRRRRRARRRRRGERRRVERGGDVHLCAGARRSAPRKSARELARERARVRRTRVDSRFRRGGGAEPRRVDGVDPVDVVAGLVQV